MLYVLTLVGVCNLNFLVAFTLLTQCCCVLVLVHNRLEDL